MTQYYLKRLWSSSLTRRVATYVSGSKEKSVDLTVRSPCIITLEKFINWMVV